MSMECSECERVRRAVLALLTGERSTGVEAIASERRRQIEEEGWSAAHDDKHIRGELGAMAACYAVPSRDRAVAVQFFWPRTWDSQWWKPSGPADDLDARRRDLVKAGASIAAEIERVDRLIARAKP